MRVRLYISAAEESNVLIYAADSLVGMPVKTQLSHMVSPRLQNTPFGKKLSISNTSAAFLA